MAHGQPDFNRAQGVRTTYQVLDAGENAARQFSIDTFDRRGDVIYLDDFEAANLNKWAQITSGAGASIALSTARARNGVQSVLLAGGSSVNRSAEIIHSISAPVLSNLGFEIHFATVDVPESYQWQINVYDGTNLTLYEIRFTRATSVLAYLNSSSTFTTFATGIGVAAEDLLFRASKLVIAGADGEYRRFILDNVEYDISGNAGEVSANALSPRWEVYFRVISESGDTDEVYVDDAICTQNEP